MAANSTTKSNQFITLAKAVEMTTLYRREKEKILKPEFKDKKILPVCETFDRAAFDSLLALKNCVSIRIYLGMDTEFKVRVIGVAANEKGEDILPSAEILNINADTLTEGEGDEDGEIIEEAQRCPDHCPPGSPLNEP